MLIENEVICYFVANYSMGMVSLPTGFLKKVIAYSSIAVTTVRSGKKSIGNDPRLAPRLPNARRLRTVREGGL